MRYAKAATAIILAASFFTGCGNKGEAESVGNDGYIISPTGEYWEAEIGPGKYIMGKDFPQGILNFEAVSGSGWIESSDGTLGMIMEADDEFDGEPAPSDESVLEGPEYSIHEIPGSLAEIPEDAEAGLPESGSEAPEAESEESTAQPVDSAADLHGSTDEATEYTDSMLEETLAGIGEFADSDIEYPEFDLSEFTESGAEELQTISSFYSVGFMDDVVITVSGSLIATVWSNSADVKGQKKRKRDGEPIKLESGTYVCGEDIPEGTYIITASEGTGTVSDSEGELFVYMAEPAEPGINVRRYSNWTCKAGTELKVDGVNIELQKMTD